MNIQPRLLRDLLASDIPGSTPTNLDAGKVFDEEMDVQDEKGTWGLSKEKFTTLFNQYCNQHPVSESVSSDKVDEVARKIVDDLDKFAKECFTGYGLPIQTMGIMCEIVKNKIQELIK